MRIRGLIVTIVTLAATCLMAAAQSRPAPQAPLEMITTARAVHSLSLDQAVRAYPVHLRAVVTYYDPYIDPRHGAVFVCDVSGCIFVSVPVRPVLSLKAGTMGDITGVTGPGDFAPVILAGVVRTLGQSSVPANPRRATLTQIFGGSLDGQWVEIQGRVRSVHFKDETVALQIATDGGSFDAITVRQDGVNYESFIDSLVRVRGNAAAVFNTRRQMVGARVFFATLGQIGVVQAAPGDPFAVPAVPIAQLFRFSPDPGLLHRAHVQGTVTLDWPGRMLCIQGQTDGLCMETTQTSALPVGSFVDVVGFPAVSMLKPTLEDAVFRAAQGPAASPQPAAITADQGMNGDLDGSMVEMDAELIGRDPTADVPALLLRSHGVLFSALLPRDSALGAALPWKEGSLLRVTGVCNVQVNSLSSRLNAGIVRPESMHLLLRSASDVVVLHAPAWWTPMHVLQVFALVGVLILAAVSWIVALRYRVNRQTRALRTSEACLRHLSEHDALTGLPNRLLLNDRLETALKRAERFQSCLGLLMVDVDEFKEVNDGLGHQAGDMLLCELGERLNACVRATDTVARMGGDEFIVLLPDLRISPEAEMIAAKIVAAIASPVRIDQTWVAVTVSVGVATCPPTILDAESLQRCADEAMYAAKKKGHNCFEVYRPQAPENGSASEPVLRHATVPSGGA